MKPRSQFPSRKIGMFLLRMSLVLSPLVILGSQAKTLSKPETTYSKNATLSLTGDTNLCIINSGVVGSYSSGGDPGDVYEWIITKSTGEELLNRYGGDQLSTIQFLYTEVGDYTVSLKIRRGASTIILDDNLLVKVQKGPEIVLKPDYFLCASSSVVLTALDPATPNLSNYTILWKSLDVNGNEVVIGSGNDFIAYSAGFHFVELFLNNPNGTQACTVKGSTFVGPPIDFQLVQSALQICEGESLLIRTDTPLNGEWFIKKSTVTSRTTLGNAFEIILTEGDLSGPGIYDVFFSAEDSKYPNCPSERKITFELLASPIINEQILISPDDCISQNGSFQITSNSDLNSLEIPELGVLENNILAGTPFTYSNLKPGIYSIIAKQNGCEITKLVQLDAKNPPVTASPPTQLTPTITPTPETCTPNGVSKGNVEVDFGQAIGVGTYRLFSDTKGLINSGAIPANGRLSLDVWSGAYLLEIVIDGCAYPIKSFTIADQPEVAFSIPEEIKICETFDFIPQTQENLTFTLIYKKDGSTQTLTSGNAFSISKEGPYTLKAEPSDPSSTLCVKTKDFNVTVLQKITFSPQQVVTGCYDPILYMADIQGLLPEETSIRWINSAGEIVGRGLELYPATLGFFSLIVQPLASGFCDVTPVDFEVVAPITSVLMNLNTSKICPQPGTATVTLTTDKNEVVRTEWIFYDLNNQIREIPEFDNLYVITVDEPGPYEAVAYNKFDCEIGRKLILVEESTLLTLPNLDSKYPICSKDNTLSPIDPGEFVGYEWYFGNQLVSTQRLFKPEQTGKYSLVVTTADGCVFDDSFTTYDVCSYQLVHPNAMTLGNPAQDFRVLMSEGITEAELFIYTRQGELIHYASTDSIPVETPVLNWDGKTQGKYVPTGTYVVVITLRNPQYGLDEKEIISLLVLD